MGARRDCYYLSALPLVLAATALGRFLNQRMDGRRLLAYVHVGPVVIGRSSPRTASTSCGRPRRPGSWRSHHYALLPWEKLFEAQRKLGEQLGPILEVGGPAPWARSTRSYLGLAKVKRLKEMREQGVPPKQIAKSLRISVATVYRLAPAAKDTPMESDSLVSGDSSGSALILQVAPG